ncbi:MAG: hypothetical protein CSB01_01315 [Bacteroidia bacterium]|nr:MAG: hypothetical protein CSB01_01315 [Bacteroidia bacterium]
MKNLKTYESKPLHFGFSIGLNYMDFSIHQEDDFYTIDSVYSVENSVSPGFHLGPIINFKILKFLDLRALFLLSFGQRDMHYKIFSDTLTNGEPSFETKDMRIESTFMEFPILLKYKGKRDGNYRPYLVGGFAPKYDLAAQKKIKDSEMPKIRLNQLDYYYEFGFGMDFYLEYFKLSAEVKYAAGLKNIIKYDGTQYTSAIQKMNSRMIMFSLHFE